jgi:hypothetical protein
MKNWPRAPGAFEPWIELWQFVQDRAMKRVLMVGFGGDPVAGLLKPAAPP